MKKLILTLVLSMSMILPSCASIIPIPLPPPPLPPKSPSSSLLLGNRCAMRSGIPLNGQNCMESCQANGFTYGNIASNHNPNDLQCPDLNESGLYENRHTKTCTFFTPEGVGTSATISPITTRTTYTTYELCCCGTLK